MPEATAEEAAPALAALSTSSMLPQWGQKSIGRPSLYAANLTPSWGEKSEKGWARGKFHAIWYRPEDSLAVCRSMSVPGPLKTIAERITATLSTDLRRRG